MTQLLVAYVDEHSLRMYRMSMHDVLEELKVMMGHLESMLQWRVTNLRNELNQCYSPAVSRKNIVELVEKKSETLRSILLDADKRWAEILENKVPMPGADDL